MENVFFRNFAVGPVADSVLTIDLVYGHVADGPLPPVVRNICLENVMSESSPRVLSIAGTTKSIIENVRIIHCTFQDVEGADVLAHSGSAAYISTTIVPIPRKKGPA